jgi:hypothetical protein
VGFSQIAFGNSDCGCLQGTLLHEISHNVGYKDEGDPNAYALAHKCFSCAR